MIMFSPSSEVVNVLVELLTSSQKTLCSSQLPFYFCVTRLTRALEIRCVCVCVLTSLPHHLFPPSAG